MSAKLLPDPSSVRYDGPWTHHDVRANGIRFHLVEADGAAAADAPLVVLLHGFADFWWSWRHQLTGLAELGYRAVAVDLRGYGDSDKPPRGYDGWTLAGDIAGLVRALGHTQATLAGHAEGGWVCWSTAALHPRLVRSIAVIGAPHPVALRSAVLRSRVQRRTWMPDFLRYQLPWRPEKALTRDNAAAIADLLRSRVSTEWAGTAEYTETAERMRSAIRIPGAAHSALEYQRWLFRSQWRPDGRRYLATMREPIDIPVLSLRGELDEYILPATDRRSARFAPRRTESVVPDAGHFAHLENPGRVTAELDRLITAARRR